MTDTPTEEQHIKLPATLTVKRFAEILELPVAKVITELLRNKIMAAINDEIDFETASIIAQDLGFITEKDLSVQEGESLTLEKLVEICSQEKASGKNLQKRPPIITILGHVDHGKTTLLDAIRKTHVVDTESGGITQHISAYQVKKRGELITFIDTPGHEAFSAMRERGVSLADIAILVVAADDGVRPQTKEVIGYLKSKKIPTIVAITKIDKPEINITRVKQELAEQEIMIEEWGGKYICNEVSSKSGKGLDDLLESILLISEVEEFKAEKKRDGLGVVLESHLDDKKGPVATVLVKTGTFKIGQDILAGTTTGRIRRIEDWKGKSLLEAAPSMPATIIGLADVPNANDVIQVTQYRARSRDIFFSGSEKNKRKKVVKAQNDENIKKVKVIVKADTQGSLEAIEQILSTFTSDEVVIQYIDTGIGNITESDVRIAETDETLIVGFHVDTTTVARRLAEEKGVEIKTYQIIYELVEEIKKRMENMLDAEIIRTDFGEMEVLAIFKTGKKDMIVGGIVKKGKIQSNSNIEVQRDDAIIGSGKLISLQENKVPTDEVKQNKECGLTFEGETKILAGDRLISFVQEEKKKTLQLHT